MSKRAGFTIIEAVIAAALLATIIGLSLGFMATTTDHVAMGTIRLDLQARAQDAGKLIERELRTASRNNLVLSNAYPVGAGAYTWVSYRSVVGFDTSSEAALLDPTFASGNFHSIRFVLGGGETANAADDDGDGLIDEGSLVLYRSGVALATIAENVDGSTVEFLLCAGASQQPSQPTPIGSTTHLLIRYQLQQRGRRAGALDTHLYETSVGLRN